MNLDIDLDCMILLSTKDYKLSDLLYHKIIDAIIDRIHPKNVYKDFSNALENINAFLGTWKADGEKIKGLHAIIGIYHNKTFLFSSIWKASCYLYNTHRDIIEVTERDDTPRNFSFISSGDIADGESLILSTVRILDTLSKDDLRDGFSLWTIIRAGENIEHIFLHEHTWKNIWLMLFKKVFQKTQENLWTWEKFWYYFLRFCDNKVIKNILGYIYFLKDSIIHKSQLTRQVLLGIWLFVSTFLLYFLISSFFSVTSNSKNIEEAKKQFYIAQDKVLKASANMNNADMFSLNVHEAQTIIKKLEEQELFLEDITKLRDDLWALQKQFNGIQPFEANSQNTIYRFDTPKDIVKVVSISNKIYVVHKKSITWPILQWESTQNFIFKELSWDDEFIDATVYDTNIVLITQQGKVVNFAKNKYFSYVDVADQPTWESSKIISSYTTNLYLLSDSWNQILRHKKKGNIYDAGVAYLTDTDAQNIGNILSLAVDGWIYILKKDGSIVKLFRSPEYRLESIVINKLPKNYNFSAKDSVKNPSIRARIDLNYVYILLQNKILVFKPNTIRYQDVKSLQYIWQVEGKNIVIEDFYIDNDGEIFLASTWGIYKLEFDVVDDKLILK